MESSKIGVHIKKYGLDYLILIAAVLVYFLVTYPVLNRLIIDYDSTYQVALTNHTLSEIWELLPYDYSPPFYAFFIKLFSVFGTTIEILRLSSLIPYVGAVILALLPLRRAFGEVAARLSAICFIFTPIMFNLLYRTRPHVMGFFFVTGAFIFACLYYKYNLKKDLILLTVFSVLSMYTHNVAMVTVFGFYVAFVVVYLIEKDYKNFKNIIVSGVVCAVCYIPWLIIVIHQMNNVMDNYWANFMTIDGFISALFLNHFSDFNNNLLWKIGGCIVSIYWIVSLVIMIKNKGNDEIKSTLKENSKILRFLILIFIIPIYIYIFINLSVMPIYSSRYVYQLSGMSLILFCLLIAKTDKKKVLSIFVALIMVANYIFAVHNFDKNHRYTNIEGLVNEIKNRSGDDIAFVHSHEWSLGVMMYYFPNARHYFTDESFTVLTTFDVFPSEVINVGDPENIFDYEEEFYVFDCPQFNYVEWEPKHYYMDFDDCTYDEFNETYYDVFNEDSETTVGVVRKIS